MTIENDFLPFATANGANVLTQAQYAALAALATGYQSGVANSAQLNKTWRQSSIMSAVLAQFIVNQTGQPAIDDGTTATLLANLATAVAVSARQNPVLPDTGTANSYAVANLSAFSAYPTTSGLVIDVSIANANTGASTLNVDGLGTKPIYGLALQPLQGGELVAKGVAALLYVVASTVNGGNGAWILMECPGGAQQVANGTQTGHAVNLGQFASSLAANGYAKLPNGMILQWGTTTVSSFVSASSAGTSLACYQGSLSATFPLAFPNACLEVCASPLFNSQTGTWGAVTAFPQTVNKTSMSGPVLASFNPISMTLNYYAIGW